MQITKGKVDSNNPATPNFRIWVNSQKTLYTDTDIERETAKIKMK